MNKKARFLLFVAILLVAVFLRLYRIDDIPPSLNWDEVSIGYNAYSILKTARDEWGQLLPLSFRAFGDYKLPLYIYLDVPFIALLGLNETAVKLPSILSGIGIVLLTFLIIKELTKNILLAFWGMFISAILPWLIIFSRVALEANLALFLTCASFYLLILSQKRKRLLPYSAVLLGLSAFSYNSSRVLILPLSILAVFFMTEFIDKKEKLVSLALIIVFTGLAFFQTLTVDSKARYRWTTILDEGAITEINQLRGLSKLPPLINQIVNNKATYFITQASKNYISHFNPAFLFWNGGSNYQFSVPGTGYIYLVLLPFVLLGVWQIIRQKQKWQLFILGWIFIAPIPAAITRDAPHALRAIFLIVPLLFTAVLGLKQIMELLPLKVFYAFMAFIALILLGNTYLFWSNYENNYRKTYSQVWQYGYKQAVEFVKANQESYDRIVFTKTFGEPHIFVLFYLNYDPNRYQNSENLARYKRSDWFWVDRFDKYEFINDWEIKDKLLGMKNVLLVTSPGNYPSNSHVLQTVNFLDGKAAFDIVELN